MINSRRSTGKCARNDHKKESGIVDFLIPFQVFLPADYTFRINIYEKKVK